MGTGYVQLFGVFSKFVTVFRKPTLHMYVTMYYFTFVCIFKTTNNIIYISLNLTVTLIVHY